MKAYSQMLASPAPPLRQLLAFMGLGAICQVAHEEGTRIKPALSKMEGAGSPYCYGRPILHKP